MQSLPPPYNQLFEALRRPTELTPRTGTTPAWHQWSPPEVAAVIQAWASERPLLIRGEAGCGKSQLARALAEVLSVPLIVEVIHPHYEASDLLYREDPVRRLAEAQLVATAARPREALRGGGGLGRMKLRRQLDPARFVSPGPLLSAVRAPEPGQNRPAPWPRAVVLIDEIDKADADLPNALLGVFGDRVLTVAPTGQRVSVPLAHRPLVLVTTNEDRELPPAFVRRCAVLNMRPQDQNEPEFVQWLVDRARAHLPLAEMAARAGGEKLLEQAAAQVWDDREAAKQQQLPTVGLAEYLDLLYSLYRLSEGDPAKASLLLNQLAPYALVKHRDQDQGRAPAGGPAGAPADE